MHKLVLICLATAAAFAQGGKLGAFTDSADIGAPPMKGAAEFDAAAGQYRITGTGTDIWGKADQFHYVWRAMSGNFAVTATTRFLTEGNDHRKAAIMLRQSTDTDSPYCDLVIHGNGMPGVQFRNAKGENTNTVDFAIEGPGIFKLKLVRQGATVTVFAAKEGAPLRELGHTSSQLRSPVLVGLGVSSHTQTAVNTVLFSDVSIEQLPAASRNFGVFTNAGDVGDPAKKERHRLRRRNRGVSHHWFRRQHLGEGGSVPIRLAPDVGQLRRDRYDGIPRQRRGPPQGRNHASPVVGYRCRIRRHRHSWKRYARGSMA